MVLPGFDDDAPIDFSPLGRRVTRGGVIVLVLIYRVPSEDMRWTLEVENHLGRSTCWEVSFATDQEAYKAFEQYLNHKGIRSFTEPVVLH